MFRAVVFRLKLMHIWALRFGHTVKAKDNIFKSIFRTPKPVTLNIPFCKKNNYGHDFLMPSRIEDMKEMCKKELLHSLFILPLKKTESSLSHFVSLKTGDCASELLLLGWLFSEYFSK